MSELKQINGTIIFSPVAGWTINRAIAYSIDLAKQKQQPVQINMNDISLKVDENSNVDTVKKYI